MTKENPLNEQDKVIKRLEPELESDDFSIDEMKAIVDMVVQDAQSDIEGLSEWFERRKHDIMLMEGEKPSILETLEKEEWQSDRNLNLCAATCDAYQATLLATCYNPDTIHFKATEKNDIDNKDNLETFTKWSVGASESDIFPEVDDFINNKVTQGFSVFKIYWKVWYEWVDRRIPKKGGGFTIKTENMRFEKGIIENIANLDDFLTPVYGKNIQELSHCIHILHKNGSDILDLVDRKVFKKITKKQIDKLKQACFDHRMGQIGKEKAMQQGLKSINDLSEVDLRVFPVDIYEWYGEYERNGKRERYRFHVEPITRTFLSGKPLRKINRLGKYPFVGRPLIRVPGQLRGKSLPNRIESICNAVNNIYNQKSDFQSVENCPIGFHNPDERYNRQEFKLVPGTSYPVAGDPSQQVYFPNISRSLGWAYQDIQFLMEMLEKLTGAASYFMTNDENVSGTATRDNLINEKSETRFGLWVKRIIADVSEAITIYVSLYQDWAPPKLGERVLGEKGEQLFKNLTVDNLRGNFDCVMSADIIAGSKTMEKQLMLWGFENLQMTAWLDPRINPKGNWNLVADTWKRMGMMDVERYLPPEPPADMGGSKVVKNEWHRFMQGEAFDPEPTDNVVEHYAGHLKQKQTQYHELPDEYKPNFDDHYFKTMMQFQQYLQRIQEEKMANALAMNMVTNRAKGVPDLMDKEEEKFNGRQV